MMVSFLLVGQSNMSGRGYLGEASEIENDRCKMLRNALWMRMNEPISTDIQFAKKRDGVHYNGACLATSFADAYQKKHDTDVGLIPCAYGGTSIKQWAPGGLLYDNAVFQAKLAMRTSTLGGILWHQGESDSKTAEQLACYREKLTLTLSSMRRDIGAGEIPIILGTLGSFLAFPENSSGQKRYIYFREINSVISEMPDALPCCGLARADGLQANSDNLHFCAESLREFGLRYFEEYERVSTNAGLSFE